jgi:D-alanyl-D-alanine carboxypeptidase (penicillin-binding protein 5/6)
VVNSSRVSRRHVAGALALAPCAIALRGRWAIAAGPAAASAAVVVDAYPAAAAAYAVVVDGRLTWARGLDLPRPPASLTKLLTALVLLRDPAWDDEAPVTVSARAATVEGSQLGLRAGESLRAGEALTALLVRSANDACVALAEHVAGSVEAFVPRMNAAAAGLGMSGSRFGDPCGLDSAGQRSCARDLLRLGGAALANPAIAARVRLAEAAVTTLGPAPRRLAFVNGNALVGRVDGVIGMKSGFTSRAGKCVIAVAVRGAHHVWLVMLGAEERWWTAAGMIDAAFATLPAPGA